MALSARQMSLPRQISAVDSYLEIGAHTSNATVAMDALGREEIVNGKVAVLMMAGGISSRWSGTRSRAEAGIGPVSGKPLLQLQFEKILAVNRRYGRRLRCLVMVSDAVHDSLVELLSSHSFFELEQDDLWLFSQESLPIVNADSNVYLDQQREPVLCPGGHGGMLAAIGNSGYLQTLIDEGVRYLFAFQYPNALERICDPTMLGFHCQGCFEATVKSFHECHPNEKLGRLVMTEEGLRVIEHYAVARDQRAWFAGAPANMGTYIWNVEFLARCVEQNVELPYYRLPYAALGDSSNPLCKLEQFVFDLLPHACSTGLVVANRSDEYAALKSKDSLETVREALWQLHARWLHAAGASPRNADCRVEISPLFALDQDELCGRISAGFIYDDGLELR